MNDVTKFIESGILEMYVMGQTTAEETAQVEQMSMLYDEINREIEGISIALEQYAEKYAVAPNPSIEPILMANIDYMERIRNGEPPTFPPELHESSNISDYSQWLNRADLLLSEPVNELSARIIGYTPEMTTAIVWLRYGAPLETHTNELEKFLVIEGTCDITIEDEVHHMRPGDYMRIPLHKAHNVRVTSTGLCKVILQRVAA